MNELPLIEDIKESHDKLIRKVQRGSTLPKRKAQKQYFLETNALLENIERKSKEPDTFDDYCWLVNAVLEWQKVYTSLKEPINIQIPSPPSDMGKKGVALSEEEIKNYIDTIAKVIGISRMAFIGRKSTGKEMEKDWCRAEATLAAEILEGRINFVKRIPSHSYELLEKLWLKYVKCHIAHSYWQKDGCQDREGNYLGACNHIREMMVKESDIKASTSEFKEVKDYIKKHYLTKDNKVDINKEEVEELIKKKAERIFGTTGETNEKENWHHAEKYVKKFYENIITAVEKKDSKSVSKILESFRLSNAPEHNCRIINCFEAVLAIYFLDPEIIKNIFSKREDSDRYYII